MASKTTTKAAAPNPRTPGTAYRGNDGTTHYYGVPSIATQLPDHSINPSISQVSTPSSLSSSYFAPYTTEQSQLDQTMKNTQLGQINEDYDRFIKLSNQAEQQGMQSRQLNMEQALRRADVGYVNRGLFGQGGIQRYNQQDITQPAQLDMTQFQTQQQNSRDQAKITQQRDLLDVNQRFQQNQLSRQAQNINNLFPQ